MSAPFRIVRPDRVTRRTAGVTASFDSYLDRLLKMIPAEVVSLYLVGIGFIPTDQPVAAAVWAAFCLLGLVALRAYGTADAEKRLPPDWTHVVISAVAFLIWVYQLGGPFAAYGLHVPYLGSLLVLAWTFFVPMVYKGPET